MLRVPYLFFVALSLLAVGCHKAQAADSSDSVKEFTVSTNVQPQLLGVGDEAILAVTITPMAPWVLKKETPYKAVLKAPESLALQQSEFVAKDFVDAESTSKTVQTSVTAKQSGEHPVSADISFFLCTDTICKRLQTSATVTVSAKP